jgi:UDP-N-acetylglucosamine 4,6-dehydratase/5-epimerase
LATAVKQLFGASNEIRIIGTRHGEKAFETLLNREELAYAQDLGGYYRIPVDARDLNYNKYFVEGEQQISGKEDYTSNNTKILNVEEIKDVLLKVEYIQKELSNHE